MYKEENIRPARPEWLKVKAPGGDSFAEVKNMMRSKALHTVCEEAHCPNISECWNHGTATFMILGDTCVRSCTFCAVKTGRPHRPDPNEPMHVAESIKQMKLKHAVITSVTRDDLKDSGAAFWAEVIRVCKQTNPNVTIEVLIPDLLGKPELLDIVYAEKPDILNHNMETVASLYDKVRPQAIYDRSLFVLDRAKKAGLVAKTGIMVGVGETKDQVVKLMQDLRAIDVDIMTIGQYLQPTKSHLAVERFVHPDEFKEYERIGLEMGFRFVESGPLVRSSYHAEKHVH
jgi:lipoic acid synthetase